MAELNELTNINGIKNKILDSNELSASDLILKINQIEKKNDTNEEINLSSSIDSTNKFEDNQLNKRKIDLVNNDKVFNRLMPEKVIASNLDDKLSADDQINNEFNKLDLRKKTQSSASLIDDFTEPFDEETIEQRNERKQAIKRNLHNQKAYYDQKNNLDSDEASDIQSNVSADKICSLDDKMREMIRMFIQSFVPFNLIHGSYFSNLLRNSFNIRKMPKLVQMRNFFEIIYELGHKYICQTISGAQSYTLIFEFWKTANRRHQFITVRASYIDVFVRRAPVLTCFKVYHDWTAEKYIDKFNFFFKRYKLERSKVFSCVTNLKARRFLEALDMYGIGSEKLIFCLVHQLNNKFNELLLNCDYEEDKIHYEEKLKEYLPEEILENKENNSDSEDRFSDDFSDDQNSDKEDNGEENLIKNEEISESKNENQNEEDDMEAEEFIGKIGENEERLEEEDEEIDFGEDSLAYVKLIEEPKDVLKILNKQKLDETLPTVRVIKELLKSFAYISTKQELLDELNELTLKENGQEFYLYHLIAYKNWNYLHQFLFYIKMTKDIIREFMIKHPEIPFKLNDHDFEIIEDLFDILAFLVRRMNELSLEESIGLGKTLNIMKYFINSLPKLNLKTEEARYLKDLFLNFFKSKHGIYERCNYCGIASLLDPKSTRYDFKTDHTFKNALKRLHEMLCYRLDKNFNLALYRIRAPLRIEIENFHRDRPFRGSNDITKFQLNSPVLQNLVYDYFTTTAICFEPKKIDFEVRDKIIECLSQIRSDTLSKVLILNSLDNDVIERIIDHAKFW